MNRMKWKTDKHIYPYIYRERGGEKEKERESEKAS